MDHYTLPLLALLVLGFGLFSGRLEKTPLTPAMVFMFLGMLLGPSFADILKVQINSAVIKALAEATLALVLFTDASRINLAELRKNYNIPLRLLGVGLPLCVLVGWGAALWLLPGLSLWAAALLSAILAPTDAALGQAVVTNEQTPLRVRQALNVESGLNDGMALPLVLVFASLAAMVPDQRGWPYWTLFTARQLLVAPVVGIAVGLIGGWLLSWADKRGYSNNTFQDLSSLSLAALAYCLADMAGASGLISTFVAGLTLGNTARKVCDALYEFAEAEGQLFALGAFMSFGAMMAWPAISHATPVHWLYAVLSLTVLRMAPVALSLVGSGLRRPTVYYIGWFGPRGLASILFAMLLLEGSKIPGQETVLIVVGITVFLSVILHGLSAWPLSKAYGKISESWPSADAQTPAGEHLEAGELPLRLPPACRSHACRPFWRHNGGIDE